MNWSFDVDGPVEAEISIPAGVVEVDRADARHVEVRLDALGSGGEEAIGAAEVSCAGGRLGVELPTRPWRNAEVRCRVTLPAGSRLATRTASADVLCTLRLGAYTGTTASGDVTLADVDGDLAFKTASGDLSCGEVGGRAQLSAASGDVRIGRATGEVESSSASGDLLIGDAGASVRARSASGDVRIERATSGLVRVDTASGDLVVGVARGVGARLDVTSVSGELECSLPFDGAGPDDAALEIACRTVSGDVRVEAAS